MLPVGSYSAVYRAANSNTGCHLTEGTVQAMDVWTNCLLSAWRVSLTTQQSNLVNSRCYHCNHFKSKLLKHTRTTVTANNIIV